jgi:2-polyprenyl-3-methyl-5-hydroxy-6-metoxy-1,4-benzoquinol methylase
MNLAAYPKQRPPLSEADEKVFRKNYHKNRSGEGALRIVTWAEGWMHREIVRRRSGGDILEVGAGNLNHLPYEREFSAYDIVEPWVELQKDSPTSGVLRHTFRSVDEIPPAETYDRILSIATFEHLTDLPQIVAKVAKHLCPQGVLQVAIPSEGSLSWSVSWRATTAVLYWLKYRRNYAHGVRHEHVNTAMEVEEVIRHFFRNVSIRKWPLPWFHLSLYTYIEAIDPDLQRVREYLNRNVF